MGICPTTEREKFFLMDIDSNPKYKLNITWFIGKWTYNGNKLYIKYGHLGFGLPGGNIYGFGPDNNVHTEDIFSGKYYGVIKNDTDIFSDARKEGADIKKIEVNITEGVYNQINNWDKGIIDYSEIDNIVYGIRWNKDFELGIKNKNLLKQPYSNCVSFLNYLNPIFIKNNLCLKLSGYEILGEFDIKFSQYSTTA